MNHKKLTFPEALSFIDYVVSSVFIHDEKTGRETYIPELYHYSLGLAIAHHYDGYEPVDDMNEDYPVALNALREINGGNTQLSFLIDDINRKIQYRKEQINCNASLDMLVPKLSSILDTFNQKISEIDPGELNRILKNFDMKDLVNLYLNSDRYAGNTASILDEKTSQIIDLKEKLSKAESEIHE